MKAAQGEGVGLREERDYRMKWKDEKCEEEEQRRMGGKKGTQTGEEFEKDERGQHKGEREDG